MLSAELEREDLNGDWSLPTSRIMLIFDAEFEDFNLRKRS
jgi:hypothetical protein